MRMSLWDGALRDDVTLDERLVDRIVDLFLASRRRARTPSARSRQ